MIIAIPTSNPHVFIIKHDNQSIGKLNTLHCGAFISYPKEIYKKRNAFGLINEFLYSNEYRYNYIFNIFETKVYYTTRQYLKNKGIEDKTKFGLKTFLPLPQWKVLNNSDNQLILIFPEAD
jgi:hypothetical protein